MSKLAWNHAADAFRFRRQAARPTPAKNGTRRNRRQLMVRALKAATTSAHRRTAFYKSDRKIWKPAEQERAQLVEGVAELERELEAKQIHLELA
jgi:beta-phosphoglucomutase-like phosphatase (HAD superfamily)